MKIKILILASFLFCSCTGSIGAGSLGGWDIMVFPVKEPKLDSAINSFFIDSAKYGVPKKWEYESEFWKRGGYDFLKARCFYFNATPEEMYYISYISAGTGGNPDWTRLSVRAVYSEKMGWREKEEYSKIEQIRIQKRFNKFICNSLEFYTGVRSFVLQER